MSIFLCHWILITSLGAKNKPFPDTLVETSHSTRNSNDADDGKKNLKPVNVWSWIRPQETGSGSERKPIRTKDTSAAGVN